MIWDDNDQEDRYRFGLNSNIRAARSKTTNWENQVDRYKLFFDSVSTPALLLDLDNNIEDFNDCCLEYFPSPEFHQILCGSKVPVSRIFPWLINPLSALGSGNLRECTFQQQVESPKGQVIFRSGSRRFSTRLMNTAALWWS